MEKWWKNSLFLILLPVVSVFKKLLIYIFFWIRSIIILVFTENFHFFSEKSLWQRLLYKNQKLLYKKHVLFLIIKHFQNKIPFIWLFFIIKLYLYNKSENCAIITKNTKKCKNKQRSIFEMLKKLTFFLERSIFAVSR